MSEPKSEAQKGQDFPGSPLVEYLPFNAGDAGSVPGRGTEIPQLTNRNCGAQCANSYSKKPVCHNSDQTQEAEKERLIPCPRSHKKLWGAGNGGTNPGVSDPEVPASNWHFISLLITFPKGWQTPAYGPVHTVLMRGARTASDPQST